MWLFVVEILIQLNINIYIYIRSSNVSASLESYLLALSIVDFAVCSDEKLLVLFLCDLSTFDPLRLVNDADFLILPCIKIGG